MVNGTEGGGASNGGRHIAIVGRLGVYPMVQLTVPARRIMAYLALHDGSVTRAQASSGLWPDIPESQGRTNLRRALWHVPEGWVASIGDQLTLQARIDYPECLDAASRALAGAPLSLADLQLLSDDLLPGWHEEWALTAQDAFHQLRVQALEAACRSMASAGMYALATQAGTLALAAEPLSESAADALIAAHLGQGNRFAAARCFRDFCLALQRELGVPPNAQLIRRISSLGLRTTAPPVALRAVRPFQ